MKILIVDNYDSFTFNLHHLVAMVAGVPPIVVANDRLDLGAVEALGPDAIILSPGPGHPANARDFGVGTAILAHLRVPLLGVCLGHQGLAHAFGGRVARADEPVHGRTDAILHAGTELFRGIPQGFQAVRYHSLVVDPDLPDDLERTAWTEGGIVMGLRHRRLPFWGVQFHPESICTEQGDRLIANFLGLARARARARARTAPSPGPRTDRPRSRPIPAGSGTVRVIRRPLPGFVDPEDAFVALYEEEPDAFWLDSGQAEEGRARYSFMGAAAGPGRVLIEYRSDERRLRVTRGDRVVDRDGSIFDLLDEQLRALRSEPAPGSGFGFDGGLVGYLGYELKAECGADPAHRADLPDAMWMLADRVIAFDHRDRSMMLVALATGEDDPDAEGWLRRTERRLGSIDPAPPVRKGPGEAPAFRLRRDREAYLADIEGCLEAIRAGETYEVCLTNRIEAPTIDRPLDLYRVLRRINPAPQGAFLRFGPTAILCSSPEQYLKIGRDGRVTSRPIKGTAARERDPEEDRHAARMLALETKSRSENLMIVDLLRNDLGRVCEPGSVRVPELMQVESYATVHQLVSTITGQLEPGRTAIDCIRATFPGGSMTGAPKRRTMEIIDRIEGAPRGIYSGCIGYLSTDGSAELNIVIRTAVVDPTRTTIGIGGAIVALSDPEAEFEETLLKGRAIVRAIDIWSGAEVPTDLRAIAGSGPVEFAATIEPGPSGRPGPPGR